MDQDEWVFQGLRHFPGTIGEKRVENIIMDEAMIVCMRDGKEVDGSTEYLSMSALAAKIRELRQSGTTVPQAYEQAAVALMAESVRKKKLP